MDTKYTQRQTQYEKQDESKGRQIKLGKNSILAKMSHYYYYLSSGFTD